MHTAKIAIEHYGQKIREHKQAIKELKREREAALPKRYTAGEEICSSITHGIGTGLAIAALAILVTKAVRYAPADGKTFYVIGFAIFGATLVILYLMSTLYHALTPYSVKKIFAVFDHSSIYLLIAGTYTAICLSALRGTLGWALFGIIWALAAAGITLYAIFGSKMRMLSLFTYLPMGWLIVFAGKPAIAAVPWESMKLLLLGGAFYTVGSIFYALKKIKWTHCVWHVFVLAGSAAHFFSVMALV
jgi:hemolysin III